MVSRLGLAALLTVSLAAPLAAQDAKSTDLAKQLAQLLDQKKLDAVAMADAQNPGSYSAALYFPGTQLLVVYGKYSAPALLSDLLARKDYHAAYAELASASDQASRLFVMDTYADGLMAKPNGTNAPDSVDSGTTHATFDGDWKKAKMSEADYQKSFARLDAAYARVLQGLIAHLKTSGT
jgi:hypothetical protein